MASLLDHISLFALIIAVLLAIFVLDQRAAQTRAVIGCIPQGVEDLEPGPLRTRCANFFALESTVEYLFLITTALTIFAIALNVAKTAGRKEAGIVRGLNVANISRLVYTKTAHAVAVAVRVAKEQVRKKGPRALPYAVLLGVGIVFWSPGIFSQGFFIWNDATVHLNLAKELDTNYYAWYDVNLGSPFTISSQLSLITFYYIINSAGLPLVWINHLFMLLSVTVAGWSMYYVLSRVLKGEHRRTSAYIGAIFYMLSPVVATFGLGTTMALSYSLFPLFFYFVYAGLSQRGNEVRNASAAGLVLLGIAGAVQFVSLAVILTILLAVGIMAFRRSINIRFLLATVAVGITINLFWIGPLLFSWGDIFEIYEPEVTGHTLEEESATTDILLSARLLKGSFFDSLDLGWVGVALCLLPAYSLAAVILCRRKIVYFFAGLALFSVLFSTGIKYPVVAELYSAVTWTLPELFVPLQNLDEYLFLASFSYAILFAFTTQSLVKRVVEMKNAAWNAYRTAIKFATFSLIALLVSAGSFFSLVGGPHNLNHDPATNIPPSYFAIERIIPEDDRVQGYRMLVLPWHQWYVEYTWTDHDMVDIVHRLSSLPTLGYAVSATNPNVLDLRDMMINSNPSKIAELGQAFSDTNIKYILVHKDFRNTTSLTGFENRDPDRDPPVFSYEFNSQLAEGLSAEAIEDNENYTLYELPDVRKTVEVFSYGDDPDLSSDFKKVNPTLYAGTVSTKEPAFVIFGQQYDSDWRLLLDRNELEESRVSVPILANFTFWEKEGTGNEIVTASLGGKEIVSGSSQLTNRLGENYYYMNGRMENPVDLSSYDAISIELSISNVTDDVVRYVTLHDADGKRKEIFLPETDSEQPRTVELPLVNDMSKKPFDMSRITGISLNVVNNDLPLHELEMEIHDMQMVRNSPFLYGGYAIGWRMEEPGTHTVQIEYEPQSLTSLSAAVSIISFLFAAAMLVTPARAKRILNRFRS